MIDQEQARKFWANWVRREIGGNDMVQEAAVDAALHELQAGRDSQAAAAAAQRTAESLGVTRVPAPVVNGPALASGSAIGGEPGLRCKLCGSTPAANMTIHEHNGRVVWMVHKTNKGPFCRDCAIALLRHHQNNTLFQGWFGIFSFFITPVTLLLNLNAWQKAKRLGPPQHDPAVESKIPAPLPPGRPLHRRYGLYVAGVVLAAAGIFLGATLMDKGGCLDSSTELANRMTTLHNAFVQTYNADFKTLNACQSVACERAPKLDIAASLKTYSAGLGQVCWPTQYQSDAQQLIQVNNEMAKAFTAWASASTTADDQSLAAAAKDQDGRQGAADEILSNALGVKSQPAPSV